MLCFRLFSSLKPRPFVQSSFDMQAFPRSHVYLFLIFSLFVYLEMSLFPNIFFVPFPLSVCIGSTSYVLYFRMVFFYLVTTGWIFDISLCENAIIQKNKIHGERWFFID